MTRPASLLGLALVSACGAAAAATPAPAPPASAPEPPPPGVEIRVLDGLRVGPSVVRGEGSPKPSTAEDVDRFVERHAGSDARCADAEGWTPREGGGQEKICGLDAVRIGGAEAWLRFHVLRDADGTRTGLRLIEIVPPLMAPAEPAASPPRPWADKIGAVAEAAYGPPERSENEDVAFAVWQRPDRLVALAAPTTGDRGAALIHMGLEDPDRGLFVAP